MFTQLIEIKRRRGQGARRRISKATIELQTLKANIVHAEEQLRDLHLHWHKSNENGCFIEAYNMHTAQKDLNEYYLRNLGIKANIEKQKKSLDVISEFIKKQQTILNKTTIEQEKLSWLQEQYL